MANLGTTFDPSTVDDQNNQFDPLPAGIYNVVIDDSELKPTKAGTGHYLQLTYRVVGGKYGGRLVWDRLNIDNPNATAQEIAFRSLSAICKATGHNGAISDSAVLHGKTMAVKLTVRDDPNYGASNEVKAYSAATQPPAQKPAAAAPPWAA